MIKFKESIKENTIVKVETREQVNNLCDWLELEGMGTGWDDSPRKWALESGYIFPEKDFSIDANDEDYPNALWITYEEALVTSVEDTSQTDPEDVISGELVFSLSQCLTTPEQCLPMGLIKELLDRGLKVHSYFVGNCVKIKGYK